MGNNKNKLHHRNNRRNAYRKKKLPYKYKTQPKFYKNPETILRKGSRIINLEKLQQYTNHLTAQAAHCQGSILLYGETRQGLASIVRGHYSVCDHTIVLESSQKVKGSKLKGMLNGNAI